MDRSVQCRQQDDRATGNDAALDDLAGRISVARHDVGAFDSAAIRSDQHGEHANPSNGTDSAASVTDVEAKGRIADV
jgi:hypothetical protein